MRNDTGIVYIDDMRNVANVLFHAPCTEMQVRLNDSFNDYLQISGDGVSPFIDSVRQKFAEVNDSATKYYIDTL